MYTYIDVWQKPTQFCKASILQLKNKLNFFRRKKFLKRQRYDFASKGPYSQNYVFPGSHVQM